MSGELYINKTAEYNIRFVIVEDSRIDELSLLSLTDEQPELTHIATAHDALEAIRFIKDTNPDLVFMDIDIPGGSGIELVRILKEKIPMVVFVTSHGEYAIEGFELSAIDYLVKPYSDERFAQAIRRVADYWQMKKRSAAYELLVEQETLYIKEGYNQMRLHLGDIMYLEAMQDYTKVVTDIKKYMVNTPLSSFLQQIPPNKFLRIHRSYAVPYNRIKGLNSSDITLLDDNKLPIGKTYRASVTQHFKP